MEPEYEHRAVLDRELPEGPVELVSVLHPLVASAASWLSGFSAFTAVTKRFVRRDSA